MTNRQLQVGEMIKRTLSEIVRETVLDKSIEGGSVIISEVRMSPDLKFATVYVLPVTGSALNCKELLASLNKHSSKIKLILCKRVSLRHAPNFVFKIDETLDKAQKINKLIEG